MRRPVNEPGPVPTAIAPSSPILRPAARRISSTAPGNGAPCEVAGRAIDATTLPLAINASVAVEVEVSSPRTGRAAAACSSSRLTLHNTRDVIEDYERHQQKQPYLEHRLAITKFERLAARTLEREEQQMPAVEQRHRQQVYNSQLEAEHHGKHRETRESAMRLLARQLRDHDRTAQRIAHRRAAAKDTGNSDHHLDGHIVRSRHRFFHRAERAVVLGLLVAPRLHSDHPGGRVSAVNCFLIEPRGRDYQRAALRLAVLLPLDLQLDR